MSCVCKKYGNRHHASYMFRITSRFGVTLRTDLYNYYSRAHTAIMRFFLLLGSSLALSTHEFLSLRLRLVSRPTHHFVADVQDISVKSLHLFGGLLHRCICILIVSTFHIVINHFRTVVYNV